MIHLNDSPGYQASSLRENFQAKATVSRESFWIRDVQPSDEPGTYVGTVDNDLLFTGSHGLELGDRVSFTPDGGPAFN